MQSVDFKLSFRHISSKKNGALGVWKQEQTYFGWRRAATPQGWIPSTFLNSLAPPGTEQKED